MGLLQKDWLEIVVSIPSFINIRGVQLEVAGVEVFMQNDGEMFLTLWLLVYDRFICGSEYWFREYK